jgi:phosphate starvation-inducible PhoH-like protein
MLPRRDIIDTSAITGKTRNQEQYIKAIKTARLVFSSGPAGVGKTYLSAALAAEALRNGSVEKIIITRPAVEAGESLGFLPGELEDKYAPYLAPVLQTFHKRLGKSFTDYCLKTGKIQALPLAYTRGVTFSDAFVLLDEAQNTTPTQMKMFLTRIGENCTIVVNGDLEQKDIPGVSGLEDAIKKVCDIPEVKHVRFTDSDVVRSGLVSSIIHAYRINS